MTTILCIEDESDIREDICEELTDAGYNMVQACDGSEGLQMILYHRPDMVISDITMPKISGYKLLAEVRENHPEFADMPFIFLSALADRNDVINGIKVGADDYLTKPIDFALLLAKVDARLRQTERMTERKQEEQIKLYSALTKEAAKPVEEFKWRAEVQRKIALVGKSNDTLWDFKRFFEKMGHEVMVFTSGRGYLNNVQSLNQHLTLLWAQSDDINVTGITKMLQDKRGAYVLVVHTPSNAKTDILQPGKLPTYVDGMIKLPISKEDLVRKLSVWI